MSISISKLSRNQWLKVAKVFLWLTLSFVITLVPAFLTKHAQWLAATPGVNFVLYTLSQLFQNDLANAQGQVPVTIQPQVNAVVADVQSNETPVPPTT